MSKEELAQYLEDRKKLESDIFYNSPLYGTNEENTMLCIFTDYIYMEDNLIHVSLKMTMGEDNKRYHYFNSFQTKEQLDDFYKAFDLIVYKATTVEK